jgi:excisionase family DNA binding protein
VANAPHLTRDEATAVVSVPLTTWLTVVEAAARAKVSKRLIYSEVRAGRLRAAKVSGRRQLRFTPQWVDDWLIAAATPVPVGPSKAKGATDGE